MTFASPKCIMVLTCRDVLFSENGELKKAVMVSKTTLMMYFSRMGSVRRFSRLLQTCRGQTSSTHTLKDWKWLNNNWFQQWWRVSTLSLRPSVTVPRTLLYPGHVHCEVFKQLPDVVGRVDFLHLHLGVHVTVIHKVHVGHLHLDTQTDNFREGQTAYWQ